jgi:hypothetical protein
VTDPIVIRASNNPDDMPVEDWQALGFAMGENTPFEVWDMVHRTAREIRAKVRRRMAAEIEELRAENDRLRTALEES